MGKNLQKGRLPLRSLVGYPPIRGDRAGQVEPAPELVESVVELGALFAQTRERPLPAKAGQAHVDRSERLACVALIVERDKGADPALKQNAVRPVRNGAPGSSG